MNEVDGRIVAVQPGTQMVVVFFAWVTLVNRATSPELERPLANFHILIRKRESEFNLAPLARLPTTSEVLGSLSLMGEPTA